MKRYTVEITNEALADMEQLYNHSHSRCCSFALFMYFGYNKIGTDNSRKEILKGQ